MRLTVYVGDADYPVIDSEIPRDAVNDMYWYLTTSERRSPRGFPFVVSIELGVKSHLQVFTTNEKLLDVGLADQSIEVDLLLPTGERLRASIDDRIYDESGKDATLCGKPWHEMRYPPLRDA